MRGDAGHRKGRATRSESSEKTQALSTLGRVGGRQQALEMTHIACALLPTRRDPGAIPMGQYHQDLVLPPRRPLGIHGACALWCPTPRRHPLLANEQETAVTGVIIIEIWYQLHFGSGR